ncbi:IS21 family transposase, partial [Rhizobium ruizarguesonis]
VDLDTNSYSVPWRLIGARVQVVVLAGRVIIRNAGQVVADHAVCAGRRQRIVDRDHFVGVAGADGLVRAIAPVELPLP